MTSERTLARALWRLAEEAEKRGIRILVEAISGEHYATSATKENTIYRLTHHSCSCKGFFRWQRCTHHSLLLAQLGWLPEEGDEPDPAPPVPQGGSAEPSGDRCPTCRCLGTTMRQGASGAWFAVPCPECGGSGRVTASGVATPVPLATPPAEAGETETVRAPHQPASAAALPDPWDSEPAVTEAITAPVPGGGEALPAPIPFTRREDRARELAATVEEAIAALAEQLAAGHSEEYLQVLTFYSRFHRYSIPNTILIRRQRPDASLVAGLKRWNQVGYRVRAGERAIWIWAPMIKKDVDAVTGEEAERVVGFRPAPVFADPQLADIETRPLPSLFRPLPDDCEEQYQAAKGRIIATGIQVEEQPLPGGVQGASLGGRILIRSGLDSRNKLLVLAHELAHELAHHGDEAGETPLPLRELQAESVAYVVGQVLGVENPFSGDYLLSYGLDAPALQAALITIQQLVRRVLAVIRPDQADEEVPMAA